MSESYDFYIEPCQLCIERAGTKKYDLIDGCGWCNDADTHYEDSSEHPGAIVKIPHHGDGYPFHESPHPERKYFKGRKQITSSEKLGSSKISRDSKGNAQESGSGGKLIMLIVILIGVFYFFSNT